MRFALLGDARSPLPLARAIAGSADHELVCTVGAPQCHAQLTGIVKGLKAHRNCEELISSSQVDAVIVAGGDPETLRGARLSAEAGQALLIDPSVGRNAGFFYELTLLAADRPTVLFPLFALRGHPLVLSLRTLLRDKVLGAVQHVQLERTQAPRSPSTGSPALSSGELAQALLEDGDLLRFLIGEYNQVTASRSGTDESGYSLATVTLNGTSVPQAVWMACASPQEELWRLTVVAEGGKAVLWGETPSATLHLDLQPARQPATHEATTHDSGAWLLERFLAVVGSEGNSPRAASGAATTDESTPGWNDLARVVEIVEGVEQSVKRRRMIDIQFETPSERGMFKTHMTAAGCSLLVLQLVAIVAYLVGAFLLKLAGYDLPPTLKRVIAGLIFLPLAAFLALQLMVFIARPAGLPRSGTDD